jgi:glc operon protein GlcG
MLLLGTMCRCRRVAQQRQFNWRLAMQTKPTLDSADAQTLAAGCLESASRLGVSVSIAVVDEAGKLIHFIRMDGARAYTADLAIRKAQSSAAVGVPTSMLEALARERPMQDVIALRGGIPVLFEGKSAGAVGVSGAKPEIDDAIATAGIAAMTALNLANDGDRALD